MSHHSLVEMACTNYHVTCHTLGQTIGNGTVFTTGIVQYSEPEQARNMTVTVLLSRSCSGPEIWIVEITYWGKADLIKDKYYVTHILVIFWTRTGPWPREQSRSYSSAVLTQNLGQCPLCVYLQARNELCSSGLLLRVLAGVADLWVALWSIDEWHMGRTDHARLGERNQA